jgi:hypothetical protein
MTFKDNILPVRTAQGHRWAMNSDGGATSREQRKEFGETSLKCPSQNTNFTATATAAITTTTTTNNNKNIKIQ